MSLGYDSTETTENIRVGRYGGVIFETRISKKTVKKYVWGDTVGSVAKLKKV